MYAARREGQKGARSAFGSQSLLKQRPHTAGQTRSLTVQRKWRCTVLLLPQLLSLGSHCLLKALLTEASIHHPGTLKEGLWNAMVLSIVNGTWN